MSLSRHLRQYDSRQVRLKREVRQHPGAEIVDVQTSCRYLLLSLINDQLHEAKAFLNIERWLLEIDAHLPGIPWQQVPLSYLVCWLNNMQMRFMVGDTVWDVQHIAEPEAELPEQMLLLPAQPCPLLCLEWPLSTASPAQSADGLLTQISFTLQYVLGNSQLTLETLADAAVGDLLLIKQYSPRLFIGRRHWFTFSYHQYQEIVVEQHLYEESQDTRGEEETLLQWSQLPVDIEFVLDSHSVTLEELENIGPGAVLPVSPQAEQKVKIYLNRKLFARGELVALDNGTLAVEINQLNYLADGRVGCSDVKQ